MVRETSELQERPPRENKPLSWTILLINMTEVICFCYSFQPILWGGVFSGKHLSL